MFGITDIVNTGLSIIDKVIPDPAAREQAKLELVKAEQKGELKELQVAMSAIVAEAQSKDGWTSRARPSFLYVMYVFLLSAIPMGILFAVHPESVANVTTGVKQWLESIPEPMWTLFGAGYLGYCGSRSYDKRQKLKG